MVEDAWREGGEVVSIEDEEERGAIDAWVADVGRALSANATSESGMLP